MPVRSLNSAGLKWPDAETVGRAMRDWAENVGSSHPEILCIGYFGSYARGDWGVGSDLDLLVIVEESERPFWQRSLDFDLGSLPVPAEALIYTQAEWEAMGGRSRRFYETARRETVWVYKERKSDHAVQV